jgi:hypothetical protein
MARDGFVGQRSIVDFFGGAQPKNMDNFAVRMISGVDHQRPFGEMNAADLEIAKSNLASRFATFGLVESLEQSIERFVRIFNLKPVPIGFANVAAKDQETTLPEDQMAMILGRNELDQELYAFAVTLFQRG